MKNLKTEQKALSQIRRRNMKRWTSEDHDFYKVLLHDLTSIELLNEDGKSIDEGDIASSIYNRSEEAWKRFQILLQKERNKYSSQASN